MKTVGIVLAAGESRRMGSPKALLRGADGVPLAAKQAAILRAGGCAPVAAVLGSEIERIRRELPLELATVANPRWSRGRASSLQAGISAFPGADGYLFLPVDAVDVRVATILAALAAEELMRLPLDARIDEWVRPRAQIVEVDDPAILRNVNTPEEWAALSRAP